MANHLFDEDEPKAATKKAPAGWNHLFDDEPVAAAPNSPRSRIGEAFEAVAAAPLRAPPQTSIPQPPVMQAAPIPPSAAPQVSEAGTLARFIDNSVGGLGRFLKEGPRDAARYDAEASARLPNTILQHATAAGNMAREGVGELVSGNIAPSFQGAPDQWKAGGAAKTLLGLAGVPGSLVSGPAQEFIQTPVTQLTGNKNAGEIAAMVVPGRAGASVVRQGVAKFGPSSQAVDKLVEIAGPENVIAHIQRMKENPNLRFADVSSPVRDTVRGLIDPAQPKAMQAIDASVQKSAAGAQGAARGAYERILGPSPDAVAASKKLASDIREVGKKEIEPVVKGAATVDISPVVKSIDDHLAKVSAPGLTPSPLDNELARFKQTMSSASASRVNAGLLHDIQSELGDTIRGLSRSADPKDRKLAKDLKPYHEQLVTQIDEAADGAYRPARQKYAMANRVEDAFYDGMEINKNPAGKSGLEHRPEALRDWMNAKSTTPEMIRARQLGALDEYQRQMSSVRNAALKGQTIPEVEMNHQKMAVLFGKKQADDLRKEMKDLRDIMATNNRWGGGSDTAKTTAAQAALAVPPVPPLGQSALTLPMLGALAGGQFGVPHAGAALGAAGVAKGVAQTATGKLKQWNALSRNEQIARLAGATNEERGNLLTALMNNPKVISAAKKSGQTLLPPP